MEASVWYIILSIVGFFGTMALGINAYFLKGIYDRVGTVEVSLATVIVNDTHKQKEIDANREDIKLLFSRLNKMEGKA